MDLTQHFDWDGREIARDCIGDGPAVVFCHGTPFSSVLWQPFAEALSDRYYASLMLVDVVAIPPSGSPFFQFVQSNPGLLGELPGYIHRAIVRAYISNASLHGLRDDVLNDLVEPWTGGEGQDAFSRQIAQYDEKYLQDNEDRLEKLTGPLHIVWGEQDAWVPLEMAHRLHDLTPGSTLRIVPTASHLLHYDAPAALMNEVTSWLDRQ